MKMVHVRISFRITRNLEEMITWYNMRGDIHSRVKFYPHSSVIAITKGLSKSSIMTIILVSSK